MTGLLANESYLDYAGGEWVSDGDIVDVAFLVLAKKLGLSLSRVREEWEQVDLIPYESERAFSGSLNRNGDRPVLHVKGSPEKLLSTAATGCRLRPDAHVPIDRESIEATGSKSLAGQGYRVIALAQRTRGDATKRHGAARLD
ncbi:MAG: hypothetical protein U5Q16_10800 [Gammaproteobacteria bacterium]|nr:hypothetical protein [Gammaproteobacteria bacterium]